mgnify:CR=1 FL=1
MDRSKIGEWSWGYNAFRMYVSRAFRKYYRHYVITGKENVPLNEPVLFTVNHQNALMDALAILLNIKRQPVFLARQDIFKGKRVINLLTFMKILPVYRIRDGASSLKKNEKIFSLLSQILKNNGAGGIMPEGNHGHQRKLRVFGKGAFRIGFQAQQTIGPERSVLFIPVGLDFKHYQNFRTDLLINFGKPIRILDYMPAYDEDPVDATNRLRDDLRKGMSEVMVDIQSKNFYDAIQDSREILITKKVSSGELKKHDLAAHFREEKKMVQVLENAEETDPDFMAEYAGKIKVFKKLVKDCRLRTWLFQRNSYSFAKILLQITGLIIALPVFLFGWVHNIIPYSIPVFYTKKVKDAQFHSSFKFVLAILLFPVFYLIIFALSFIFLPAWWLSFLYLILMPVCGHLAFKYYIAAKKIFAKIRYNFQVKNENSLVQQAKKLNEEILQMLANKGI